MKFRGKTNERICAIQHVQVVLSLGGEDSQRIDLGDLVKLTESHATVVLIVIRVGSIFSVYYLRQVIQIESDIRLESAFDSRSELERHQVRAERRFGGQ